MAKEARVFSVTVREKGSMSESCIPLHAIGECARQGTYVVSRNTLITTRQAFASPAHTGEFTHYPAFKSKHPSNHSTLCFPRARKVLSIVSP